MTTESNALYTMSQVTDRRSTNGLHDSLHQWLALKVPVLNFIVMQPVVQ